MRFFLIFIAIGCLLGVGGAAFVWSGFYNIAANVPHWQITRWFLEEVRERSVAAHSKGVIVPALNDPKLADAGFRHYHAMCRLCHNAPGYPRTEISQGLYPPPPDFTAKETVLPSGAEIYWMVRNGIKMTGMPAFGPTHTEEELWGIVAFVKRVPNLKPEEYRAMERAARLQKGEEHHH